jgi:excinuclease ABC subunit C
VAGDEERPDLVVIDGGRGQISSAVQGMLDAGGRQGQLPPVVGIAKRLDDIYFPDRSEPVQIPHASPALRLLQQLRDEAHRFAITYHRKVRGKASTKSLLETIPGIGPIIARRLLEAFGSLDGLRGIGAGDLVKVDGMTAKKVDALLEALKTIEAERAGRGTASRM